jgi:hypothetical protein
VSTCIVQAVDRFALWPLHADVSAIITSTGTAVLRGLNAIGVATFRYYGQERRRGPDRRSRATLRWVS